MFEQELSDARRAIGRPEQQAGFNPWLALFALVGGFGIVTAVIYVLASRMGRPTETGAAEDETTQSARTPAKRPARPRARKSTTTGSSSAPKRTRTRTPKPAA